MTYCLSALAIADNGNTQNHPNRALCTKNSREKNLTFPVFFVLFTRQVSPSGIYGTRLLLYAGNDYVQKKENTIRVYSRGIVGLTGQQMPSRMRKVRSCNVEILRGCPPKNRPLNSDQISISFKISPRNKVDIR